VTFDILIGLEQLLKLYSYSSFFLVVILKLEKDIRFYFLKRVANTFVKLKI